MDFGSGVLAGPSCRTAPGFTPGHCVSARHVIARKVVRIACNPRASTVLTIPGKQPGGLCGKVAQPNRPTYVRRWPLGSLTEAQGGPKSEMRVKTEVIAVVCSTNNGDYTVTRFSHEVAKRVAATAAAGA